MDKIQFLKIFIAILQLARLKTSFNYTIAAKDVNVTLCLEQDSLRHSPPSIRAPECHMYVYFTRPQ